MFLMFHKQFMWIDRFFEHTYIFKEFFCKFIFYFYLLEIFIRLLPGNEEKFDINRQIGVSFQIVVIDYLWAILDMEININ